MRSTAYHEAAHAVAMRAVGLRLDRISLGSAEPGKVAETVGESGLTGSQIASQADCEGAKKDVVVYLAGDIAEAKLRGETYKLDPYQAAGHTSDERDSLGRLVLLKPGDYAAQDALLDELHDQSQRLVNENWDSITAVAEELLKRTALTGREVKEIIARA